MERHGAPPEEPQAMQSPVSMGTWLLPRSLLTVKAARHSKTNLVRKDLDSEAHGKGKVLKTCQERLQEVVEETDGHNCEGQLGTEKGLRTLERQRQGVLWLGGGLTTKKRSCVSQDGMQERAEPAPERCWRSKWKRK